MNSDPRSHEFLMKNLSARHGMLHYELFIRESLEAPQTMQAIAIALECIPELDNKGGITKETTHSGYRTQRYRADAKLVAFSLLAEIHNARRCYRSCCRRKVINSHLQL